MIDFASQLGIELMDWQKFVAIHGHKVKPDGRWATSEVGLCLSRQNGKSTLMMLRILTGMFVWGEGLQLASAHRLTTSLETFRQIVGLIETHPELEKEVKKIRWQHGAEEIELFGNRRFVVKAANNAARGLSKPETIHMDELREYKDEDAWSSMRYSMMSAKNPQVWVYSSAGDQHSIILNKLRERALASAKWQIISWHSSDVSFSPSFFLSRIACTCTKAILSGSGPGALPPTVINWAPLGRISLKSNNGSGPLRK